VAYTGLVMVRRPCGFRFSRASRQPLEGQRAKSDPGLIAATHKRLFGVDRKPVAFGSPETLKFVPR
jgi:hypothetical protein